MTRDFTDARRDASFRESIALLDRYFGAVARSFGNRVRCALSGGYDSRLILAYLRRHGLKPSVYVYGSTRERDVQFAQEIAQGEGFPLDIIDKDDRGVIPPLEFAETARRNFLATDGYGYASIFHNGAETEESARRVFGDTIAINGGGGEIFRNFFYLLDRGYTIREILWSFYSRFDPATCTGVFDRESYYRSLERKVMYLLGSEERWLPRPTVEWLYRSFRCRAWDGKVDTIAGWYGFTAMPYLERSITSHASALPLHWKNHGAYEAELIRRIDSRLAGYRSIYGHDFSRSPPPSRRLSDYWTYLRPPWVRRYTYRLRHLRRAGDWPGYLGLAYQEAVLSDGAVILQRLLRIENVMDQAQFARILSLEYALRQFGSRANVALLRFAPCLGLFADQISIPSAILRSALTVVKFLGLFRVARYITRDGLRIICYHGIAVAEEYKYRSRLFVRKELFRRRIEYLRHKRYPILRLGESLEALARGRLPACATVITMDDGWEGVYSVALPIIKELAIPVTLYVPTFYIEHLMPVFTVPPYPVRAGRAPLI